MVRLLNKFSTQHNFLKESLRQVLRLFIVVAFLPQIAINRFPVPAKQFLNQRLVTRGIVRFYLLYDAPVCGLERPSIASNACMLIKLHCVTP
jgi:hypothetical protein